MKDFLSKCQVSILSLSQITYNSEESGVADQREADDRMRAIMSIDIEKFKKRVQPFTLCLTTTDGIHYCYGFFVYDDLCMGVFELDDSCAKIKGQASCTDELLVVVARFLQLRTPVILGKLASSQLQIFGVHFFQVRQFFMKK